MEWTQDYPQPSVAIFYPGGRRPHALKCASRDQDAGLIPRPLIVDHGAIWTQRSKVASMFLDKGDREWLLMIDGDLRWRDDMVSILAAICCEHRGIVGAVVSRDRFGEGLATMLPPGPHSNIGDGSMRSIETPEAIGSPMAIHRSALEAMVGALGISGHDTGLAINATSAEDIRAFLYQEIYFCHDEQEPYWTFFRPSIRWSEPRKRWFERADDSSFCDRARACGVDLRVAYGPMVEHWGEYGFTFIDGLGAKRK